MMSGISYKIFHHGYYSNSNSGNDDRGKWNNITKMFHVAEADMQCSNGLLGFTRRQDEETKKCYLLI